MRNLLFHYTGRTIGEVATCYLKDASLGLWTSSDEEVGQRTGQNQSKVGK